MSYRVKSGGSSPPIYEKERALRMARKLGLRIVTSSGEHGSRPDNQETTGDSVVSGPIAPNQESRGPALTGRFERR